MSLVGRARQAYVVAVLRRPRSASLLCRYRRGGHSACARHSPSEVRPRPHPGSKTADSLIRFRYLLHHRRRALPVFLCALRRAGFRAPCRRSCCWRFRILARRTTAVRMGHLLRGGTGRIEGLIFSKFPSIHDRIQRRDSARSRDVSIYGNYALDFARIHGLLCRKMGAVLMRCFRFLMWIGVFLKSYLGAGRLRLDFRLLLQKDHS